MSPDAVCWIDGKVVPAAEARISVFDHGFLYGDGVFEGVRFYAGQLFRWPLHLNRLQSSARALNLAMPMDDAGLTEAVMQTVKASPLQDGYLRIIVTRGVGPLGINPATCHKPAFIVIADGLKMVSDEERAAGVRTIIASTRRSTPDRLDSRIKSLNYLNAIFARMEANFAGVEEAILLNDRGFVAEGTADNLFVVQKGELLTPPATEGALAGITRQTIIELAVEEGIPMREVALTPYDLYNAQEMFLTGTGAKLIPVREVDGRPIRQCPGPVYQQLTEAFSRFIQRECGEPKG